MSRPRTSLDDILRDFTDNLYYQPPANVRLAYPCIIYDLDSSYTRFSDNPIIFSQLGITKEILDGSANEATMLNYYNRTIEPIISAITEEMERKFLTKTARTQGQAIRFFRDPFRLVPVAELAEIADKFTRNEIMTSNEIRQIVGMNPSSDPKADELRNKNLSEPKDADALPAPVTNPEGEEEKIQNEV